MKTRHVAVFGMCAALSQAWGQDLDNAAAHQQAERLNHLKSNHEASAQLPRRSEPSPQARRLPSESSCIVLDQVVLYGWQASRYAHALAGDGDPAQGRCIGAQGVQILIDRVQHALIAGGYLTARVAAPEQDLNAGVLRLDIIPGYIGRIRSRGPLAVQGAAWAIKEGQILNLRDIEQTIENVRRLAGADLNVDIVPGEQAGHSDLILTFQAPRTLSATISLDDSGQRATGRLLAGATLSWNNPLGLGDVLYANLTRDVADRMDGPRGNRSALFQYGLPWRYWSLQALAFASRHHQQVRGKFQAYRYHGRSRVVEVKAERVVFRSASTRSSLWLQLFARGSKNFIDDAEIRVQRRRAGGWEAGWQHSQQTRAGTWDLDYRYKRGTGAFGSLPAPEERFGEGTSRLQLSQLSLSIQTHLGRSPLGPAYHVQWQAQWAHTRLTAQDEFCIGGRRTVRGFGVSRLCGDTGWTLRNEIRVPVPATPIQLYLGVDTGEVREPYGPKGMSLTGVALGLRTRVLASNHARAYLDAFIGKPLKRPSALAVEPFTAGFSLQISF